MKQPPPEAVDISEEQYNQLLRRVEQKVLSEEDWKSVILFLKAYGFIARTVKNQKVTIKKLRDMLFGKRTEKDKGKNKKPSPPNPDDPGPLPETQPAESVGSESIDAIQAELNPGSAPTPNESTPASASTPDTPPDPKPKPPGHGQRGHDSWKNADVVWHQHTHLKSGCPCPKCKEGTLYPYDEPGVWVRFNGQPPLIPEVHKFERLRCNPCGELFTAPPPEDLRQNPKATPEARATAAIVKYQAATPFNRFAEIQKNFGHPIPRTRIWTLCQEMGEYTKVVLTSLIHFAAQGSLIQNDDTKVRILQLMKENQKAEEAGVEVDRTGMYTTGIVSKVGNHKVYLFFSSRKHAGENLADILKLRDSDLPPPSQVCDASSMNTSPGKGKTDVGGCHDHSRRRFYEIRESFPKSCGYALGEWKIIYAADATAKKQGLNDEERMRLHQRESEPVVHRLHAWCTRMLEEKRVDPRGSLGGAMSYFLDNYVELTLFLRKPGVPISNCECEQALKTAIGVRKMAYFFKTLTGAKVADGIFSLIATCNAAGANLFHYLVALQNNESKVTKAPHLWYPWNYHLQLNQA